MKQTKEWLDLYFAGKEPEFLPPLAPEGSEFQKKVWKILLMIPYGKTMTYGEIGRKVAEMSGKKTMSAQAVGGAGGRNERQPHWVCGRNREEDRTAETGTDGYVWDVCAEERDGAVVGK